MSNFIITPTNVDYLESIFRDPITGQWTIPIFTYNTAILPYQEFDYVNDDPKYQKRVINNLYIRLVEKWLYKDYEFKKLLKYFKVDNSGDELKVSLATDLDNLVKPNIDKKDEKYIFRYIEKIFITKRFIAKILKRYVATTRIKWYDLYHNTSLLKELIAHKLKKLIESTIYSIQDKKTSSRVVNMDKRK